MAVSDSQRAGKADHDGAWLAIDELDSSDRAKTRVMVRRILNKHGYSSYLMTVTLYDT